MPRNARWAARFGLCSLANGRSFLGWNTSHPIQRRIPGGGGFGGFFHGFLSKLKVGIGDATSVQKMIDQVCRLYVCLVSLKVPKRRKLIGEIETHIFSNGLKPPTNQVAKDYPRFAKCLCVCCFFRIFVHAKLPAWPENAQAGQTCHLWKFCVFFLKDGMCSGSDRGLVVSITTRWTLKVCVLHEIIRISFKKFWMYFLEGIFEMVSLGHFVFQQNHCSNSACHLEPLGFLAATPADQSTGQSAGGLMMWECCERTVGFPRIPFNDTGLPWVTYVTWWIDSTFWWLQILASELFV